MSDALRTFTITFAVLLFVAAIVGSTAWLLSHDHPFVALFVFIAGVSSLITLATR